MDKLVIQGGARLEGTINASGSKNSSLPIIAATLLAGQSPFRLHRIPDLRDIATFRSLLHHLGAESTFADGILEISPKRFKVLRRPTNWSKK